MVEQLAFNQRVAGSSPARLILNLILRATKLVAFSFVYSFIYTLNQSIVRPGSKEAVSLPGLMLTSFLKWYRKACLATDEVAPLRQI